MPDISMCNGVKYSSHCPKKDTCYRHKAKPCEFRQSYFMNAPFEIKEDLSVECKYYWPLEGKDNG